MQTIIRCGGSQGSPGTAVRRRHGRAQRSRPSVAPWAAHSAEYANAGGNKRRQIHETADRTCARSRVRPRPDLPEAEGTENNLLPSGGEVVALGDRPWLGQRGRRRRRRRHGLGVVLPRGSRQAEGSGASDRDERSSGFVCGHTS